VKGVGKPDEGEPHVRIDGGSWRRGSPVGHRGSQAGVLEHATIDGLDGTQSAGHLPPRQLPTRLRPGVSHATFHYLRAFTWRQVIGWLRRKHRRSNWKELRRRHCNGGWRPAGHKTELFDPEKVGTTRYQYRGSVIPSPWPTAA